MQGPVVSSLSDVNTALIARHNCRLTYRAGDAADCHRRFSRLLDDGAMRQRMGAQGCRLLETQFNATSVSEHLVKHLETVAASRAVPAAGATVVEGESTR